MKIRISDIKGDKVHLELESDSATLELEDYTPFRGAVNILLDANRIGQEIYLKATVSSRAHLLCDRCAKEFDRTFSESTLWIYTTQRELLEGDQEDVYLIEPDQAEIDITEPVREQLIVMVPVKSLCKEECKGLCAGCGADLNVERCTCTERKIDHRWDALSQLIEHK